MSAQVLCPSLNWAFLFVCLFVCFVVLFAIVLYEFLIPWKLTPYQIYFLQIFSPISKAAYSLG